MAGVSMMDMTPHDSTYSYWSVVRGGCKQLLAVWAYVWAYIHIYVRAQTAQEAKV